jgi:(p)ppGpp synthase/HD superfamily hydrolase
VEAPPFICDLELTCRAFDFAQQRHAGQTRDSDAAPFILHPLEVAVMLRNRGYDDAIVAAGLLHDTVEDSAATTDEIAERFGPRVGALVAACTDDASIAGYSERKAALRASVAEAGADVHAIYAADKVAKARELRAEIACGKTDAGDPHARERMEHYEASLEMLERDTSDNPLVRQLRFELWALQHLPPQRP